MPGDGEVLALVEVPEEHDVLADPLGGDLLEVADLAVLGLELPRLVHEGLDRIGLLRELAAGQQLLKSGLRVVVREPPEELPHLAVQKLDVPGPRSPAPAAWAAGRRSR